MSLIITATDFTEAAQNAVKYACQLASAQKGQVLILHSYMIPIMFSDVPMPSSVVNDAQAEADKLMDKLVDQMQQLCPGIEIKGSVVYGETIEILDEYEESTKPLMIVVGNNSASGDFTWLDNTLHQEFKKLKYPVLAIPPHYSYSPVKKICFAYDNKHDGNDKAMLQLKDITRALGAELHVVNTQPDVHNQDNNVDIDPHAKIMLAEVNPHFHIVFDVRDVDSTILDFVKKNDIDWLVMIPRKLSFFEGLFHKSHTKAIAQHLNKPIVALHELE